MFCVLKYKLGTPVFGRLGRGITPVLVWWEGKIAFPKRREIALNIFALVFTSPSFESNFVHSKLCNQFGHDKAKDAFYTYENSREFKYVLTLLKRAKI